MCVVCTLVGNNAPFYLTFCNKWLFSQIVASLLWQILKRQYRFFMKNKGLALSSHKLRNFVRIGEFTFAHL